MRILQMALSGPTEAQMQDIKKNFGADIEVLMGAPIIFLRIKRDWFDRLSKRVDKVDAIAFNDPLTQSDIEWLKTWAQGKVVIQSVSDCSSHHFSHYEKVGMN